MGITDLTSWERRQEYYNTIQLGKDVRTQTQVLSNATRAMLTAQAASTNAIITSQERIREGIEDLAYGIDEVREGIYGLKAAFEFGISEVVWQIEQNRTILKSILEVLMAPLDTQAKELRKRAEDAYANGWFEDALDDFTESEKKNKYDFSVHISIGMIYLFQLVDRGNALEYFEKAAKYARPKSAYHASFALLHAALIKRDENKIDEAERLTAEAVDLSPDFAEALYQNSQFNAQLKNHQKCIPNLEKAINIDRNYCLKADRDEMFNPVRHEVNALFERLRDEAVAKAEDGYKSIAPAIDKINEIVAQSGRVGGGIDKLNVNNFSAELSDVKKRMERRSFFDGLDAQASLQQVSDKCKKCVNIIENSYRKIIDELSDESSSIVKNANRQLLNNIKNYSHRGTVMGGVMGFLLLVLVATFLKQGIVKIDLPFSLLFFLSPFLGAIIGNILGRAIAKTTSSENQHEVNELENKKTILLKLLRNLQQVSWRFK